MSRFLGRRRSTAQPDRSRRRDERGDVPGWVMITVMSAGIVAALTAVAGPRLQSMLEAALASVGG
ncbi:hypothetical protein CLV56_2839 [Mumia flava]|uniref:Uncharacterized protein n=1 Tax=Mumia flava TaxID=1348852 RepID=A0A0B2BW65_9ACTN|nr:hypothetical protein [Mumia flava]PJJ58587.1 hypothetical protein CLV56_2839 [Mumia flava]